MGLSRLVLVITHDEELAFAYGDRVIRIEDGEIASDKENKPTRLAKSIPQGFPQKKGRRPLLSLKTTFAPFAKHPFRTFASLLLLALSFGALTPLLSVSMRSYSDAAASFIKADAAPYLAIRKSAFSKDDGLARGIGLDELAAFDEGTALPVFLQSYGPDQGFESPYSFENNSLMDGFSWSDIDKMIGSTSAGFAPADESRLANFGMNLVAGSYPEEGECLISSYSQRLFARYGFLDADGVRHETPTVSTPKDFLSISPEISVFVNGKRRKLKVSGVLETGLNEENLSLQTPSSLFDGLAKNVIGNESVYSPHSLIYVNQGFLNQNFGRYASSITLGMFENGFIEDEPYESKTIYDADRYSSCSVLCSDGSGVLLPLGEFASSLGNESIDLAGASGLGYVNCTDFYCDFDSLILDSRYSSPSYLFSKPDSTTASPLALLACGDFVRANGLPTGENYVSFLAFAKNQYQMAAEKLSKPVPDFDNPSSVETGYLKSLYTWYLAATEFRPFSKGSALHGGYSNNQFGNATGLDITKSYADKLLSANTISLRDSDIRFSRSGRKEDDVLFSFPTLGLSLHPDGALLASGNAYSAMAKHLGGGGPIRFFMIPKPTEGKAIRSFVDGVEEGGERFYATSDGVVALRYFGTTFYQNMTIAFGASGGVLLLLAVALLGSFASELAKERSKEMALRRALGEKKGLVFFRLVVESLILALAGFCLSILFGSLACSKLNALASSGCGMNLALFSYSFLGVFIALVSSIFVCFLVGCRPALKEAKTSLAANLDRAS